MPNPSRIEPLRPNALGFQESEAGGLRRTLVEVVALGVVTVGALGAGLRIAQLEAREQLPSALPGDSYRILVHGRPEGTPEALALTIGVVGPYLDETH